MTMNAEQLREWDLRPCPFCGGPVQLEKARVVDSEIHGRRQFWGVVCRNTTNHGGSCCMDQVPSASQEAAVKRWNMRVPHAAALEEIERLKGETETLRSLYNAKHPPHERRKCSTAHDGPIESFEELSSQSHWPECQCYECRAIFVMNQEHERAEKAERRAERLQAQMAILSAIGGGK